jgi:glycosyltransferase involved in cell wall biosynthesis
MVVLEAMAAARAVVAADAGGPKFLVDPEHGGRLFPLGSVSGLGSALADLLADPTRLAEMGRFNRRRVEERFSLERFLDELESVYAEVTA